MINKQHAFLLDEFQVYEAFMRFAGNTAGTNQYELYDSRSDEKATSIEIMNVIALYLQCPLSR